MNITLHATTLLAQISKWERLGDGLHRSRGKMGFADLLPYFIGLAVIGTAIAVIVYLIKQNDFSKPCDDPKKLFRQLCRQHLLDRGSSRLLSQLAERL